MRNRYRRILSHLVMGLCGLSVLIALVPLALILFYVLTQGLSDLLNWAFLVDMPKPVGEPGGGMANAIVGSVMVVSIGALFAIPIGILSGVYAAEYAGTRLAEAVRFAADTLNGVPSIVIGVFAYGIAVLPFRQFSALAGGVALGIMMVPLIMRTTEELLRLVPATLKEGALALGATRGRAAVHGGRARSAAGHHDRHPAGTGAHLRRDGALSSRRSTTSTSHGPAPAGFGH